MRGLFLDTIGYHLEEANNTKYSNYRLSKEMAVIWKLRRDIKKQLTNF
jgi:hypothetical protein